MKRFFTILFIAATSFALHAQDKNAPVFERTYVSTDKDVYVAGDRIWCSAFCINPEDSRLSKVSAIAYIELVSCTGEIMQTAKVALEYGRGSGYLDLPASMPTGNYRMFFFTTANKNEKDYDYLENSKVISVLNSKYTTKVKDRVDIISDKMYAERAEDFVSDNQAGDITLRPAMSRTQGRKFSIEISNNSQKAVTMSLSAYHEDGIVPAEDKSILSMHVPTASSLVYEPKFNLEKEGEIIYADLTGSGRDQIITTEGMPMGYISSANSIGDTYAATIQRDGTMVFATNNIYGNRELVTEVADLDNEDLVGLISIRSPFVSVETDVPVMPLAECIQKAVIERGREMQTFRAEYRDSLAEFHGRRELFPYRKSGAHIYDLDDYTRFPTVKEVLVEITGEVRVRGRNDKQRIQVLTKDIDGDNGTGITWETSLVMLDGVPVFKHSDMMNYDALLLKEIDVWREKYIFGTRTYYGVVNFVSKKGSMAFMDFGSNVRIIDFQGTCYPMDYTEKYVKGSEKDMRQTILWKPEVQIEAGESVTIECLAPEYDGTFSLVAEGMSEDGELIHKKTTFVVGD